MRSDAEACQNLLGICVKPAESRRKSAKTRIPRHIEAHARKDRMNICEAKVLHMSPFFKVAIEATQGSSPRPLHQGCVQKLVPFLSPSFELGEIHSLMRCNGFLLGRPARRKNSATRTTSARLLASLGVPLWILVLASHKARALACCQGVKRPSGAEIHTFRSCSCESGGRLHGMTCKLGGRSELTTGAPSAPAPTAQTKQARVNSTVGHHS